MIPLIAVVGPTASGKTDLAVEIAKKYDGEVVSGDSMQIYRRMNIGTAKPTAAEMQGVPHHLIDIAEPEETYSVARFVEQAKNAIHGIYARGRLPVLAGGTGLYISSLVDNIKFTETKSDPALRESLQKLAREQGGEALLRILREFDPEEAGRLHPNNAGRIIRAIEVYRTSGMTMAEQRRRSRNSPPCYRLCMIGLRFSDRSVLYERINRRVDKMLQEGLTDEVRRLLDEGVGDHCTSMQAIGYKELVKYLRGEETLNEAADIIKRETRRYAKRQMTWFRRDERIHWIDICGLTKYENIYQEAYNIIEKSGIL